jgi:hypothetical protein
MIQIASQNLKPYLACPLVDSLFEKKIFLSLNCTKKEDIVNKLEKFSIPLKKVKQSLLNKITCLSELLNKYESFKGYF